MAGVVGLKWPRAALVVSWEATSCPAYTLNADAAWARMRLLVSVWLARSLESAASRAFPADQWAMLSICPET